MLSLDEYFYILRHDFMSFVGRCFYDLNPQTSFMPAPHIEVMASRLDACRRGRTRRLIINLPPRGLKSLCTSVALPAWILGHNPAAYIICASYGQELADKLARDCRTIMQAAWYKRIFATRLSHRVAVHDFYTTVGGGRRATSVGGVLTGLGADIIIIDDALKPEDALSEAKRKAVNDWYDSTLFNRLNNKNTGCIIIIMQRLHQDDLVGYVSSREFWAGVSFPAIAEEDERFVFDTPFGRGIFERKMGEALHPKRESLEILAKMRERVGEFNFAGQYQQRPIPVGGAIVKTVWLQYYASNDLPENFDAIVQSWDTANKSTELSDFSVCTTWGRVGRKVYLLHVYRARLNYPDLKRKVKELAEYHRATTILIEDKASGTQLVQDLQAEHLYGVVPYAPPPGNDKIMRLHAQTPWFENGKVFLPQNASWLGDYVLELTGFPGSKYDDQVDSTAQALDHMKAPSTVEIWERLGEMGDQFPF